MPILFIKMLHSWLLFSNPNCWWPWTFLRTKLWKSATSCVFYHFTTHFSLSLSATDQSETSLSLILRPLYPMKPIEYKHSRVYIRNNAFYIPILRWLASKLNYRVIVIISFLTNYSSVLNDWQVSVSLCKFLVSKWLRIVWLSNGSFWKRYSRAPVHE